ncbi:hypothetical protein ACJMK2_023609 [Sinanodonta woodiana]|uniref:F5/8 type C domain-containing protein n=1 Tax=Sinanodonta woodiana TaxID=1069815 RepID=A0ABD3T5C0_SINWO
MEPMGVDNALLVKDSQMTSSSTLDSHSTAAYGRLYNSFGAWSPLTATGKPWIQVDLLQPRNISGIFTQGSPTDDKWITKFYISTSMDGFSFTPYSEVIGGVAYIFTGNSDRNTVVQNLFNRNVQARHVRIIAVEGAPHGIALRFNLIGCYSATPTAVPSVGPKVTPTPAPYMAGTGTPTAAPPMLPQIIPVCQIEMGVGNELIVDTSQLTASSSLDNNHTAAFGRMSYSGWIASSKDTRPWIQVDFLEVKTVSGIKTQGIQERSDWVKEYTVYTSINGVDFTPYSDKPGDDKPKVFTGNSDQITVVNHSFNRNIYARYVRIYPTSIHGAVGLRFEVMGCNPSAPVSTPTPAPGVTPTAAPSMLSAQTPTPAPGIINGETPTAKPLVNGQTPTAAPQPGSEANPTAVPSGGSNTPTVAPPVPSFEAPPLVCLVPMGLENQYITVDSQFNASSFAGPEYKPEYARIYNQKSWAPRTDDKKPWIEVNFGSPKLLSGVITQGEFGGNRWVTQYYVSFSFDGHSFTPYSDTPGDNNPKIFGGNKDESTPVRYLFNRNITAQFIRIYPVSWTGSSAALRMNILGCNPSKANVPTAAPPSIQSFTPTARPQIGDLKSPTPVPNMLGGNTPTAVPNMLSGGTPTAAPNMLSGGTPTAAPNMLSGGSGTPTAVPPSGGSGIPTAAPGMFNGETPTHSHHETVTPTGSAIPMSVCDVPMGIENPLIIGDKQLSASSSQDTFHSASRGRLYSEKDGSFAGAWVPQVSNERQWIQVDFLAPYAFAGIITQGRADMPQWVTKYQVFYSNDGRSWIPVPVSDKDSTPRIFVANTDQNTPVTNSFQVVIGRFIRINPVEWHDSIALRFSVIGCNAPSSVMVTIATVVSTGPGLSPTAVPTPAPTAGPTATTCAYWTPWSNINTPDDLGEFENVWEMKKMVTMCEPTTIQAIECRTVGTHIPYNQAGETDVICDLNMNGVMCDASKQADGKCMDYEIRVFCDDCSTTLSPVPDQTETPTAAPYACQPKWSDYINNMAPTSDMDYTEHELMTEVEKKAFCLDGLITRIECETVAGIPVYSSGSVGTTCNVNSGFTCKNSDNFPVPCEDFRVRYYCDCAPGLPTRLPGHDSGNPTRTKPGRTTTTPTLGTVSGETPSKQLGQTPTAHPGMFSGGTPTAQPGPLNGATPTAQPGHVSGEIPTAQPGMFSGGSPTPKPEQVPGGSPTAQPGMFSGGSPTPKPEQVPGGSPTAQPGMFSGGAPTPKPEQVPGGSPTAQPGMSSGGSPTPKPEQVPGGSPTAQPGMSSGGSPTPKPEQVPGGSPTAQPGMSSGGSPTPKPEQVPGGSPTAQPGMSSGGSPTPKPEQVPGGSPTAQPGMSSGGSPTPKPEQVPGGSPTAQPGMSSGGSPTPKPEQVPGGSPTAQPGMFSGGSPTPKPEQVPGESPTAQPGLVSGQMPTAQPEILPGGSPTAHPGQLPGATPTAQPGKVPGEIPTAQPGILSGGTPTAQPGKVSGQMPTATPGMLSGGTPTATPGQVSGRTATPAPTPACEMLRKWSNWVNKNIPTSPMDSEKEAMTPMEIKSFCSGKITAVECQSVNGIPSYSTGDQMTCDVSQGAFCNGMDNYPIGCQDYMVRYQCEEEVCSSPTPAPVQGQTGIPTAAPGQLSNATPTAHPHAGETGTPTAVPTVCSTIMKWSNWINNDRPDSGDGDYESMNAKDLTMFCGSGKIASVECKTTNNIPYYSTKDVMYCDMANGVQCNTADNFPVGCQDYMIRYQCEETICQEHTKSTPYSTVSPVAGQTATPTQGPNSQQRETPTKAPIPGSFGSITTTAKLPGASNNIPTAQPTPGQTQTPTAAPLICVPIKRWSMWVNRNAPAPAPAVDGDKESMTTEELNRLCASGKITAVECETVNGVSSENSGDIMECSIQNGVICDGMTNFPIGCQDYKIRYQCEEQVCTTPTAQPGLLSGGTPTPKPGILSGQTPTAQPEMSSGGKPTPKPGMLSGQTPTAQPEMLSGGTPTAQPGQVPGGSPTAQPGMLPSGAPTAKPGQVSGETPTAQPGQVPGGSPTAQPGMLPSGAPTAKPGQVSGETPTAQPGPLSGQTPTAHPDILPGGTPTAQPGPLGGGSPTAQPGPLSGQTPTAHPDILPGGTPTAQPGPLPGGSPTAQPGMLPGGTPTAQPGPLPGETPTAQPGPLSGQTPTAEPGKLPGGMPTAQPGQLQGSTPTPKPGQELGETPTAHPQPGQSVPTAAPVATCTQSLWSSWINRDNPSLGDGDYESFTAKELSDFCLNGKVTRIECVTDAGIEHYSSGEQVSCTVQEGLKCSNDDNAPMTCSDYRVRYFCECSPTPTPGQTTTAEPKPVEPLNPTIHIQCAWSPWLNSDKPKLDLTDAGDLETIQSLKTKYGLCKSISDIKCRVANSKTPSSASGQSGVTCDIVNGLRCYNKEQVGQICYDYEVSLLCWSPECNTTPTPGPTPYPGATPPLAAMITAVCPPGETWNACAYNCDEMCDGFAQRTGMCEGDNKCVPTCKPEGMSACSPGLLLKDKVTCVKESMCPCLKQDGTVAQPYETWTNPMDQCSHCLCANNTIQCTKDDSCVPTPTTTLAPEMLSGKTPTPAPYMSPIVHPDCQWTAWINTDRPNTGNGDLETISKIRTLHTFCDSPLLIECRDARTKSDVKTSKQTVTCDLTSGLRCLNWDNGGHCNDYEVRFFCPCASSTIAPAHVSGQTPTPAPGLISGQSPTAAPNQLNGGTPTPAPGQISGQAPTAAPGQHFGSTPTPAPGHISGQSPTAAPGLLSGGTPTPAPGQISGQSPTAVPNQLNGGTPTPAPGHISGQSPTAAPGLHSGETPTPAPGLVSGQSPTAAPNPLNGGTPTPAPGQISGQAPTAAPGQHFGSTPTLAPGHISGQSPTATPGLHSGGTPTPSPGQISGQSPTAVPNQQNGGTPTPAPSHISGQSPTAVPGLHSGGTPTPSPGQISGQSPTAVPNQQNGGTPTPAPGHISGQSPTAVPGQHSGGTPTPAPGQISGQSPTAAPGQHFGSTPTPAPGHISGQSPTAAPGLHSGETPTPAPGQISGQSPTASPNQLNGGTPTPAPGHISGQSPTAAPGLHSGETPTPAPGQISGQAPTAAPGQHFGSTPTPAPGHLSGQSPTAAPGLHSGETPTPAPGQISGQAPTAAPGQHFGSKPTPAPGQINGQSPTAAPNQLNGGTPTPAPGLISGQSPTAAPGQQFGSKPTPAPGQINGQSPTAAPNQLNGGTPTPAPGLISGQSPTAAPNQLNGGTPTPAPGLISGQSPTAAPGQQFGSKPTPAPGLISGQSPTAAPGQQFGSKPTPAPGLISGQTPTPAPGLISGQSPTAAPGQHFGSSPTLAPGVISGQTPVPGPTVCGWTPWLNGHKPDELSGESEMFTDLHTIHSFCNDMDIQSIECREVDTYKPISETGQKNVVCDIASGGLLCFNFDQPSGKCLDYEVRVFCEPKGVDCTSPTPGQVTIKSPTPAPHGNAHTPTNAPGSLSGATPTMSPPYGGNGEIPTAMTKVPMYTTTCADHWSEWINKGSPETGAGDKEPSAVEYQNLTGFCAMGKITSIECQTKEGISSESYGDVMQCTLDTGAECSNDVNFPMKCQDYKIRYFCAANCASPVPNQQQSPTPAPQTGVTALPTKSPYNDGRLTPSRAPGQVNTEIPTAAPQTCTSGWSSWINHDNPTSDDKEIENMTPEELQKFCPGGKITRIDCETASGIPHYSSGEILSCTIAAGLTCNNGDNFPISCSDYKVKYYCECEGAPTAAPSVTGVRPTASPSVTGVTPTAAPSATGVVPTAQPTPGTNIPDVCTEIMGLTDGRIRDDMITVSSSRNGAVHPTGARLDSSSAWTAGVNDRNQYIQVNFLAPRLLTGVTTQGRAGIPSYVKTYIVSYSYDGFNWNNYQEVSGIDKVFSGNSDSDSHVTHWFSRPIRAQFLRIIPQSWQGVIAMRLEIHGCYETYPTTAAPPMITGQTPAATPAIIGQGTPSVTQAPQLLDNCIEWDRWVNEGHLTLTSGGDFEKIGLVQNMSTRCHTPMKIQCVRASDELPADQTGQVTECNLWNGFSCSNADQIGGICYEYKVRLGCLKNTPECVPQPTPTKTAQHGTAVITGKSVLPCVDGMDTSACPASCPLGQYCDGVKCVHRSECTCLIDGKVMRPGFFTENKDCATCTCVGGNLRCEPKKCPVCPDGYTQSLNMTTCQCDCKTCATNEFRCGNGQCIPSSLLCDGVIDCIDDEKECGSVKFLTPPSPYRETPTRGPMLNFGETPTPPTTKQHHDMNAPTTRRPKEITTLAPVNCAASKWSDWINRDTPDSGDGDVEAMSAQEKNVFCPGGKVTSIECVTTDEIPLYSSGETATCNIQTGFLCNNNDNAPMPCSDYKVRYFCDCSAASPTPGPMQMTTAIPTAMPLALTTSDRCRHITCSVPVMPSLKPGEIARIVTVGCCNDYEVFCKPELCSSPALHCNTPMALQKVNSEECCPTYKCICPPTCPPMVKPQCAQGYEAVEIQVDCNCTQNACVKSPTPAPTPAPNPVCKYTTTKTVVNGTELPSTNSVEITYNVGDTWSDGLCKSCQCNQGSDGRSEISCHTNTCPACKVGEHRVPQVGKCCGECQAIGCVVDGKVYRNGEEIVSSRNCYNKRCVYDVILKNFLISETQVECGRIDTLLPCQGNETSYDATGCCMKCVPASHSNASSTCSECSPRLVFGQPQRSVGYFRVSDNGEQCQNLDIIGDLKECSGYCGSQSSYTSLMQGFNSMCQCCRPTTTITKTIKLTCASGRTISKTYSVPESCGCGVCT